MPSLLSCHFTEEEEEQEDAGFLGNIILSVRRIAEDWRTELKHARNRREARRRSRAIGLDDDSLSIIAGDEDEDEDDRSDAEQGSQAPPVWASGSGAQRAMMFLGAHLLAGEKITSPEEGDFGDPDDADDADADAGGAGAGLGGVDAQEASAQLMALAQAAALGAQDQGRDPRAAVKAVVSAAEAAAEAAMKEGKSEGEAMAVAIEKARTVVTVLGSGKAHDAKAHDGSKTPAAGTAAAAKDSKGSKAKTDTTAGERGQKQGDTADASDAKAATKAADGDEEDEEVTEVTSAQLSALIDTLVEDLGYRGVRVTDHTGRPVGSWPVRRRLLHSAPSPTQDIQLRELLAALSGVDPSDLVLGDGGDGDDGASDDDGDEEEEDGESVASLVHQTARELTAKQLTYTKFPLHRPLTLDANAPWRTQSGGTFTSAMLSALVPPPPVPVLVSTIPLTKALNLKQKLQQHSNNANVNENEGARRVDTGIDLVREPAVRTSDLTVAGLAHGAHSHLLHRYSPFTLTFAVRAWLDRVRARATRIEDLAEKDITTLWAQMEAEQQAAEAEVEAEADRLMQEAVAKAQAEGAADTEDADAAGVAAAEDDVDAEEAEADPYGAFDDSADAEAGAGARGRKAKGAAQSRRHRRGGAGSKFAAPSKGGFVSDKKKSSQSEGGAGGASASLAKEMSAVRAVFKQAGHDLTPDEAKEIVTVVKQELRKKGVGKDISVADALAAGIVNFNLSGGQEGGAEGEEGAGAGEGAGEDGEGQEEDEDEEEDGEGAITGAGDIYMSGGLSALADSLDDPNPSYTPHWLSSFTSEFRAAVLHADAQVRTASCLTCPTNLMD